MEISIPMIFFITSPDEKTTQELAHGIVERKIAACANIIDKISSIYWWDGKIHSDAEQLIIVKTTNEKSVQLIEYIQKNHPYKVPECVGLNITEGSLPYLQWIVDSTTEG
jgi:periplasmic divalent cation tolerance protein